MSYGEILKLFGILAGVSVIAAFTLGCFKFKFKERLKVHKIFGFCALVFALIHGGMVIMRSF